MAQKHSRTGHQLVLGLLAIVTLLVFKVALLHWANSNFQSGEIVRIERIHVMIVVCNDRKNGTKKDDQHGGKILLQAETLLKTLVLSSSHPLTIHVAHNDQTIFTQIKAAVGNVQSL